MSVEQFGYKQELHRALTFRDLLVYGMIFMVPIAPFGVFGYVWDGAQGMVALAYLIGMVAMFFTAMSYWSMSRAFLFPVRYTPMPNAGFIPLSAFCRLADPAGLYSGAVAALYRQRGGAGAHAAGRAGLAVDCRLYRD